MKKRLLVVALSLGIIALLAAGCAPKANAAEDASEEAAATQDASDEAAATEADADEEANAAEDAEGDAPQVYVDADWIKSVIDGNEPESENYVILEVAWGEEADDPSYGEGHIPGAVHMNTDSIEEPDYWNFRTPEEFEQLFADYGITKDTCVIVYADGATNSADDRMAVAALWAGVENVKVLDGGLDAWKDAGFDLEKDSNKPEPTTEEFGTTIPAHPEYVIDVEEVQDKLANDPNFKLVSIRSEAEFNGETSGYSYIDRAGEPEGAIWGHDTDDGSYNNEDGTVVGIDTLEGYLAESDASMDNDLAFYCGTGWRACIPFLIAYQSGYSSSVMLYDGGWFVWQQDDSLPVQVGDPAGDDVEYTTVSELPTDKAA